MTRTVRLLERAGRTLLRLAPASFRTAWEDEIAATVRAACLDAHRERGWRGLIFAGMTELGSVGESALRLRLGRGPAAFVDVLDHPVHYDQTNTAQALAGTTIRCPSLTDYLPTLVRYVLDVSRPAPLPPEEITDPLD